MVGVRGSRKCLLSVIEVPLLLVVFSGAVVLMYHFLEPQDGFSEIGSLESLASAIELNFSYRSVVLQEDLSQVSLTQNWTEIEGLLSDSFSGYEFVVFDSVQSKVIYSCEGDLEKFFTQRFVYVYNSSFARFRGFRIGVCY